MHELSLAGSILQIVEEQARTQPFARLHALRIEAPALAGVEVQALRFALESLAQGTLLAGARIDIDEPPGRAWCPDCGHDVEIGQRGDPCPRCAGWRVQVTGGTALRVIELIVE